MKKILVIGSFMTDLVFKTSKMPSKGETYIGEQYEKYTGGKGANQAVAASRLGADVSMIGKLGYDEFGREHIEKLKEENIGHGGVLFDSTARTGVGNVTIDDAGDNKIIVVPGANLTLNESDIEQHKQLIKDSDIVVLQLEIPIDIVYQCIDLAEEYGKTIILNPAPAQIIDEQIAKNVDYFIPNEVESCLLTGQKVEGVDDARTAAQILLNQGYQNVIVTLGDKGAIYTGEGVEEYFDPLEVKAVDSTAAGDSFIGTFAYGLSMDWNLADIMETAIRASACTVTKLGAQPSLPAWTDIENMKATAKF